MNLIHKLAIPLLLLAVLPGCKKSEIPFYNETYNAVRFPYATNDKGNKEPSGYSDEDKTFHKQYSFFSKQTEASHIDSLPLYVMGGKSSMPRKVNVEILTEESSPANFYEVMEAVIPADTLVGYIKIRLNNIKDQLEKEEATLTLRIKDSEYLKAGPPEFTKAKFTWGIRLNAPVSERYLRTYNMLIKGTEYYSSESREYFSLNALELIVQALNWDNWDDKNIHQEKANKDGYKYLPWYGVIDHTYKAYAKILSDYIAEEQKKNPNNPKLLHDDGKSKGQKIEAREN